MHVFLIGFMGSGKSHTGQRLAGLLGRPFVDLDHLISSQTRQSIASLFESKGEAYFRQVERDCLRGITGPPFQVVACGGGTPCHLDNIDWMNRNGLTVYLRAKVGLLAQRLLPGREKRPLLQGLTAETLPAFIEGKLAEREPYYMQANVVYDQSSLEEDVAQTLYQQFSNIIGH